MSEYVNDSKLHLNYLTLEKQWSDLGRPFTLALNTNMLFE